MKKQTRLLIILFAAVIGSTVLLLYNNWNRPHTNIKRVDAVKITATALYREFSEAEQTATEKYTGKVLEVTGIVQSVSANQDGKMLLQLQTDDPMFGINCSLEQDADVREGTTVRLKGICSGFTTDVILIRCYLIKN
jgi:tRNA_anti-like